MTFSNATFSYDSDGKRVKSVITTNIGSTTSYFVGNYYQVENGVITKYYYAGSQRIAIRENGVLSYLISDHLGSTSIVTDSNGNVISNTKYKAWGEVRYNSGNNPTNYTYTGQYSYTNDFGLMFYNARWYDSSLGRFSQADTIIPSGVQGYDRYAYTNNNPIRYTDPSGHFTCSTNPDSDDYCPPQTSGGSNKPTTNPAPPSSGGGSGGISSFTPSQTLSQFETELTDYITNTGRYYGVDKEKRSEVSFHVQTINSYIFKYAGAYKAQTGFSWRPETLSYFYATLIVESQFGTAMIGDITETGDQYYARGYIQLTGQDNYLRMGNQYGVDLINKPELVITELELSARIAMNCMVVGSCTGYKLDDYYGSGGSYNFVGARDIVNPGSSSAQETGLIAQDILPIVQEYWNIFGLP